MALRKIPRDPSGEGLNRIADIYIDDDYDMYRQAEPNPEIAEFVRRLREEREGERAAKKSASAAQSASFIHSGHSAASRSPRSFRG
jgi:hypothetical protein